MNEHQARQFGDRTIRTARDTMQTEAVEQSPRGAERRYFAATEAARDFDITLTQMVQSNTIATLNFAWEVATARNPTHAAAVFYYHAHKNFETLMPAACASGAAVRASVFLPLQQHSQRR
jgi:hypothetical protein